MGARTLLRLLPLALAACTASPGEFPETASLPEITLSGDDTRIDRSVRIKPGTYAIEDVAGDGVIQVVADDVVLDLSGVILVGSAPGAAPDTYTGIGVRAEGVSDLRVRHGAIRGFKVGIEIVEGRRHSILGTDLSGNFRQRLRSTPDAEATSDWLWPHENDDDQWTRNYGAGLHLARVRVSRVKGVRVRRGQNGIVLNRCRDIEVVENDCSFLSGWGLAMWRTVECEVVGNRFDWCVRGYSHGVYARGQDSAGILCFEQCSRNVFRGNSATHGGDGFFLYAGNQTLESSGTGGSNHNELIGNDFSHAVANGIEATFSRDNRFVGNILRDCNYGVWAGYSYESSILGNEIAENSIAGVAIEHGVDNTIVGNWFRRNPVGVSLWWDPDPELTSSAFGRRRSTESSGNRIHGNRFDGDDVAIDLRDAETTFLGQNEMDRSREAIRRTGRGEVFSLGTTAARELSRAAPASPPSPPPTAPGDGTPRGRDRIFVDEWGPYDFTGLRAWPPTVEGVSAARLHLLGPDLPFRIDAISGEVEVEPRSGSLPVTVRVRPRRGHPGVVPFSFVALTEEGEISVRGSLLALDWTVHYHRWEPVGPREPPRDWAVVRASASLGEERRSDLDLRWGSGSPTEGVSSDHFATVARSTFSVPAGRYRVKIVSDDGVRVRLDGTIIHEDWTWHPPREAAVEVALTEGEHTIEVEHFEIDGHAVLSVALVPLERP